MKTTNLLALATLASATLASSAHAHLRLTGDVTARDGNQKAFPCDGARGDGEVFTFEPGATITLEVDEYIPHPGYYRVAFDADGEDDFMDPRSIKPIEANRACPYDETDQCGESDFCNNEAVLWDNLNPHSGSLLGKAVSWNIKLPDIECDNCTLQVIQVMEDTIHGGYCPIDTCSEHESSLEDIYHRCIDIKLVKGAESSPGTTTQPIKNQGMECARDTKPLVSDAGATTKQDSGVPGVDGDEDTGTISGEVNARDAGVKKDGGAKADAGFARDEDPGAAVDDSSCALASSKHGAAWTLIALGLLLARRRRYS